MNRVVILDTETTGLSPATDRIVELAALEADPYTGELGAAFRHVLDPRRPIPWRASSVHGLRDADVAGKPAFETVAPAFAAFVRGATVVAHNSAFDRAMVDASLVRAGFPPLAGLGVTLVDSVAVAREVFPLWPRHSLDAICEQLGVDLAERTHHGALVDCRLLAAALPSFARAHDAWQTRGGAHVAHETARFDAALAALRETLVSRESARRPGEIEGRFAQLCGADRALGGAIASLRARCDAEAPAGGWASFGYVVRRGSAQHVAWKDAALAILGEAALDAYASTGRARIVSIAPDDAGALGAAVSIAAVALAERGSLEACARAFVAATAARRVNDAAYGEARADLLAYVDDLGYAPQRATIVAVERRAIAYRDALRDRAPNADLAPFRHAAAKLSIRERERGAAAQLFSRELRLIA